MSDFFSKALLLIDEANALDPERERTSDGKEYPKELLYSRRMSAWLEKLQPQASDALRLAVRAQHLKRWTLPRSSYPMDRAGYLKWRTVLKDFHAAECVKILAEAGYGEDFQKRTASLIRKERFKEDPEAQKLEDTACLVFLDFYFPNFAARHDETKVVDILKKTWKKMSPEAQKAALTLSFPESLRGLLAKALTSP